jgi:FixJ family two-component response regulator
MNAGAAEYLNKPTGSFDEMLRVIRSCLHKHNTHQDRQRHDSS